jgi:hypothetical protein
VAQDFPTRDSDHLFSPSELTSRLSGKILTYFDNGKSRYYADGRYSYTFFGDARESTGGYWTVRDDSAVCVEFITGQTRCDLFVQSGERLVLVDQKGDRYPVKLEE